MAVPAVVCAVADMCQYDRQWKKTTKLLLFGPGAHKVVFKRCRGKQLCSRTNMPHLVLSGLQSKNRWMTTQAQEYPRSFAVDLMKQL